MHYLTEQRRHIVRHIIIVLLVFSVTPLKIDHNKNRSIQKAQSLERERKVNMRRLPPRFRPGDSGHCNCSYARYTDN